MWYTLKIDEVQKNLKTNIEKGLTNEEVEKRKAEYGINKLNENKKESIIFSR